jgi:hypothetical protein
MAAVAVDVGPRHWGSGERLAGRGGGHGSVNKTVRAWGEALGRREMDGRNGRIVSRRAPRFPFCVSSRANDSTHGSHSLAACLARATAPFASLSNIALGPLCLCVAVSAALL